MRSYGNLNEYYPLQSFLTGFEGVWKLVLGRLGRTFFAPSMRAIFDGIFYGMTG